MFQCFTILINILVAMNVIKLVHRPQQTPLNVVVVVINAPTQGYLRSFDIFSQFLVTSPSYSHSSSSSSWPLIMLAVSSPSSTLGLPAAFAAADIFLMAFIVGERRQGSHECAGVAVWRVKTGRGVVQATSADKCEASSEHLVKHRQQSNNGETSHLSLSCW